jgi:uncharacterized membrane protein YkvA (DUF1232 family)
VELLATIPAGLAGMLVCPSGRDHFERAAARSAKLVDWARTLKRDARAIYLAARDPRTPWYAKALALAIAAYAFSPIDLIPDFVPVLGFLDELVILPLGILAVVRLIPPEVMAENRAAAALCAEKPVSRAAAVSITLVWAASIALVGWLAYRYYAASE